jgi:hypothetical protein
MTLNILVPAASTCSAFTTSSLVNLMLAFAQLPLALVLVPMVNKTLAFVLVTVTFMFLLTASLAGAMVVCSTASVGNRGNFSDGILNWSSEGSQARSGLELLEGPKYERKLYLKPRMASRTVLVKSILDM